MVNKGCLDIVYRNWPEDIGIWIRVEKKLDAIKTVRITGPAEGVLASEFDLEEVELVSRLLQYLVSEYEKKHGPFPYILDKVGTVILMLGLKELVDKLT